MIYPKSHHFIYNFVWFYNNSAFYLNLKLLSFKFIKFLIFLYSINEKFFKIANYKFNKNLKILNLLIIR